MRLQSEFLRALLRQDATWYDSHSPGQQATRVASDTKLVRQALGDKLSTVLEWAKVNPTGLVILVDRPWNQEKDLPPNVWRTWSYADILFTISQRV